MRKLGIYFIVASLAFLIGTVPTYFAPSLRSVANQSELFQAAHIESAVGNQSEQQIPALERISIKEHKAYKYVFALLEGMTKYKGKTRNNTFYIAPVEGDSKDSWSGNTYIYWEENESITFVDLVNVPMTGKFKDYVIEEIYEKDRHDLRADVVETEEEVISRYYISKARAKSVAEDCKKNGEKITV